MTEHTVGATGAVSLVIPVYNEAPVLPELLQRVRLLLDQLPLGSEAVLVDDGSIDDTPRLLSTATESDCRIRGIRLSRNFGHQAAVSAGLAESRGAAVAVLDGDLQDPPELVLAMLDRWRAGVDVVYAVRRSREGSWWKRTAYWLFYRFLTAISGVPIPPDTGDFAVISRRVADLLCEMPERSRFLRGMRAWVGFRQEPFEYDRPPRAAGEAKYSFRKLVNLALTGILAFSDLPLRLAFGVGMTMTLFAMCYLLYIIVWRLVIGGALPGFATLGAAIFLFSGVQITLIGLIGLYVGRIHEEVKQRPHFVVESRFGARS